MREYSIVLKTVLVLCVLLFTAPEKRSGSIIERMRQSFLFTLILYHIFDAIAGRIFNLCLFNLELKYLVRKHFIEPDRSILIDQFFKLTCSPH